MTCSFGLDAASALEALEIASEKFKNDDLNKDLARDCAIKAWQLCDHVFNALGSTSRFATLGGLQDHVRHTCPELAYLQDICTASKHGNISRYTPRINETRVQGGAFSHAFSRGFDISRLEIKLLGGQTIFFNDVPRSCRRFFGRNSSTTTGSRRDVLAASGPGRGEGRFTHRLSRPQASVGLGARLLGGATETEAGAGIGPDFRFGCGTFAHPISRHALICAGSA